MAHAVGGAGGGDVVIIVDGDDSDGVVVEFTDFESFSGGVEKGPSSGSLSLASF